MCYDDRKTVTIVLCVSISVSMIVPVLMFVLLVFYITKEALLPSVIYLDSFEFNASWLVDFLLEGTFFFLSTVVIATVGGVLKLLEGLLLAPSVFLKLEPAEKELSRESLDREWCVFFF